MNLLLETGLYRTLIERFDSVATAMAMPGERPDNPASAYWNGLDFAPLLQRLARAVQDRQWSDSDVSKFLSQVFELQPALADVAPKNLDAISEAYKDDPFFRLLAASGSDDKQFFNGTTADSLTEISPRFFEGLHDPALIVNDAPVAGPAMNAGLSALEGDTIGIDMAGLFFDRNGDALTVKLADHDGALTILGEKDGILTLRIPNGLDGQFKLLFTANDGQAESAVETLYLTVSDAGPGAAVMTRNQKVTISQHDSLEQALSAGGDNMAYRLLRQTGIDSEGAVSIAAHNIILDGAAGMSGQFVLTGAARAITLRGAAAFDVSGNDLRNVLSGNAGANALSGGADDDRLLGNGGLDRLFGGTGRDQLIGGDGSDQMYGGAQDDRMLGEAGADLLDGGAGIDRAWGGAGDDIFVFRAGEQRTMAMDFTAGDDVINVSGFAGVTSFAALLDAAGVTQVRDDLRITIGADHLIIKNVTLADLSPGDFTFG